MGLKTAAQTAAAILSLMVGLWWAAESIGSQPEVWVSNSTGKCMRVNSPPQADKASKWACDNLPPSYDVIWVR